MHQRISAEAFPPRPGDSLPGSPWISRFPCGWGLPACVGPRTAQGRRAPRHDGARRVAFRLQRQRPGLSKFRGSIPSLQFPLSTLRHRPHRRHRMTRGRRGRLLLRHTTLSFASIHRSPGAQRTSVPRLHRCSNPPPSQVLSVPVVLHLSASFVADFARDLDGPRAEQPGELRGESAAFSGP